MSPTLTTPQTPTPQAPVPHRRDPAARRRAILTAAAELAIEVGPDRLTHRLVAARAGVALGSTTQYFASIDELREAALALLAAEVDEGLAEAEAALADPDFAFERLASMMHRWLTDTRQVRADLTLLASATTDPRMRELALRWYDRLVDLLSTRYPRAQAEHLAIFFDGATAHAALHDAPLSEARLVAALHILTTAHPSTETTPA